MKTDLYSQFISKSKYARYLPEKKRREHWDETVSRYVNFIVEHVRENNNYQVDEKLKNEIRRSILNMEVMPSMRALMSAGKALDRDNTAGYNCAYMPIDDVKCFDEAMYILLCGTGVGFSVERQYINKLPEIPDTIYDSETIISVNDSKEGWAKALRQLIALLYSGEAPRYNLSKLRPAGARLKTFGGRSSGPGPLDELFKYTIKTFKSAVGRKLTSLECHDLVCKIGEVVVVGGVRRSAMISLSNLSDDRMRHAKSGAWWDTSIHRSLANNSAVYTEKPEIGLFMREWISLYDSKSGERGIFNREASKKLVEMSGRRDPNHEFGTNPCFSGNTLVAVADGRNAVSIQELAEAGGDFPVYSAKAVTYNNQYGSTEKFRHWKPEIKRAIAFKSGTKKIIKVLLSNGSSFECTPDHRLAMPDGSYMEAQDCLNQKMVKFYTTNRKYRTVNSYTNGYNRQYRMIWEYHNGKKPEDRCIDHITNGAGDHISNLQLLTYEEHDQKSSTERLGEDNPIYRVKDYDKYCRNQSKAQLRKYYDGVEENEPIEHYDEYLSEDLYIVDIVDEGKTEDVYDLTVDDNHNFYIITKGDRNYGLSEGLLVHNCSEIILRPYQFCNLTEVVVRENDTEETLAKKVEIATILGTLQSTLTDFPYLRKIWKKNTEEERLLGVSFTGIYDSKLMNDIKDEQLPSRLLKFKQIAIETNKKFSSLLGINISASITCVKPSGNVSQLVDSASGIHPRYDTYYVRRVRNDNKDSITNALKNAGVSFEPEAGKPNDITVFAFPKKAPKGAITRNEISALDHLSLWLLYQRFWCEHKPSVTVNVKEEEWLEVAAWVYEHFDEVTGVSFLPYDNGSYKQAPYETITKEQYDEMVKKTPSVIDWDAIIEEDDFTEGSQSLACGGSSASCEI